MQQERQTLRSGNESGGPRDELDVANRFVESTNYDELLEMVNLGTGYYEDEELELQMRSFRKGLVADVAFDGALWERAKYETKVKLADEGFRHYNETESEPKVFRPFEDVADDYSCRSTGLVERGEEIWHDLAQPEEPLSEKQAAAMAEKTSVEAFKPVFWRMLAAYHEATKSKDARTQDNFFGRVKKNLVEELGGDSGGLLGGS